MRWLLLSTLLAFATQAQAADFTCAVTFECEGGSCRDTDRETPVQISEQSGALYLIFDGDPKSLVGFDRTSGGDRVFGGQLSDRLYGLFLLHSDGAAKLMIEGVNDWNESRSHLMHCREQA